MEEQEPIVVADQHEVQDQDGQQPLQGQQSAEELAAERRRRRQPVIVLAVAMAITLVVAGLIVFWAKWASLPYVYPDNQSTATVLVVDAGSDHTTVQLFAWNASALVQGTAVDVNQSLNCEVGGDRSRGLATFDDSSAAGKYLIHSDCIRRATSLRNTNVSASFVGGTAGFRALRDVQPERVEKILADVTAALKFGANMTQVEAKVLDEDEEGVWGWLAANLAKKRLTDHNASSLGSLDWGGASAQITFELKAAQKEEDYVGGVQKELTLYGRKRRVLTASHLCYGQVEAIRRYHGALVAQAFQRDGVLPTEPLSAPCQPGQHVYDIKSENIFGHACTKIANGDLAAALAEKKNLTFAFVGQADEDACQLSIKSQFDMDTCNSTWLGGHCLAEGSFSAPPDQNFVAVSTYYYLKQQLSLDVLANAASFEKIVRRLCLADSLHAAKNLLGNRQSFPDDVAEHACLRAKLMSALLTSGYGIRDWRRVDVVKDVDGVEVGWPLGYALLHSGLQHPYYPPSADDKIGFAVIMKWFLCLILFVCIMWAIVHCSNHQLLCFSYCDTCRRSGPENEVHAIPYSYY